MTDRRRVRGTKPVTVDGEKFASKREYKLWYESRLLEKAGRITNLKRQVPFVLQGRDGHIKTPTGRPMKYIADFEYCDWDKGGIWVVEDAKGHATDVFKLKQAILAAQGIQVVTV